ncbi:MAG: Spy/CpxP family protein refolding chaperone [Rhizomicrobium sp.]
MNQISKLLATTAFGVLCAGAALAQSAPAPDSGGRHAWMEQHRGDMAQFHARMCNDIYAHHVGRVAELGAQLDLNASQQPLFERWKAVVLDGAKQRESACLAHHRDMDHPPSVLEREAHIRDRLKDRLAAMDAQEPALAALYNSLSPDQKTSLDRMGHRGMHGGMGGMHGRMHGWDRGPGMQGHPGGAGALPSDGQGQQG